MTNIAKDIIEYWMNRARLAEAYIALTPCDPDVTPEQHAAYTAWKAVADDDINKDEY
jgi:hypothetical protein